MADVVGGISIELPLNRLNPPGELPDRLSPKYFPLRLELPTFTGDWDRFRRVA